MFSTHLKHHLILITLGIVFFNLAVSINVSTNSTRAITDADLSTETSLHERYRRLIPYMTYYLMNNYVYQQQPTPPLQHPKVPPLAYVPASQTPAPSTSSRRPMTSLSPQYVTLRPVVQQTHVGKGRYQPLQKVQEGRFVPSVQYDPKGVGQDTDYFLPVKYTPKDYEDYVAVTLKTTRPMPVPTISEAARYPTTQQTVNFIKSPVPTISKPQPQDFAAYTDFESVRFVKPQRIPQQQQQPVGYAVARPTVPSKVSLAHIIKSLQLTSKLPEVLNKDNIDSSIKTLEEILTILNMGKKESYVPVYDKFKPFYNNKPKVITETNYQATRISLTPYNEHLEMKPAPAYINRIKTQLPVISQDEVIELKPSNPYIEKPIKTQMPIIPHDTTHQLIEIKPIGHYIDRFKVNSAPVTRDEAEEEEIEQVVEIKPKNLYATQAPTPPHQQKQQIIEKIVEYYVPIVQDIDDDKLTVNAAKESIVQKSTEQPSTDNRYVTEDNRDSLLEDEKYTLPISSTAKPVDELTAQLQNIQPLIKYGVTRGKPHVDYPAYTEIPETDFSCKSQRYKGFFGDPATGCQVWHYCDLNGGKSSFLCPNGTIFSQVSLTCDWWFNVKCESTTQLYVLNERLYKYILPIMPKFPEDFSGPEVDKYLELKFKEMEAKMKEKKKKKEQEEKDKNTINTLQSIEDSK